MRLWARWRPSAPRCDRSRWASALASAGNRIPAASASGARAGWRTFAPRAEGTCVHRNGGYAERVRANARFVIPIPEALKSEHAAPLLCGGITVYNPLRTHGSEPVFAGGRYRHRRAGPHGHPVCAGLRRGGDSILHFGRQRRRSAGAGCAPLCEQPRIEGNEGNGRHTGLYYEHHQRRPGLGRLHPGAAAHRERCALWAFRPRRSRCTPFR